MPPVKWDPIVIHDVVTGLTGAANKIDTSLAGVDTDIKGTLDYDNWQDEARTVYDDQQKIWTDAATAMHKMLAEGGIPTLQNMGDNLDTTEHTNKLTWNSVYG